MRSQAMERSAIGPVPGVNKPTMRDLVSTRDLSPAKSGRSRPRRRGEGASLRLSSHPRGKAVGDVLRKAFPPHALDV